MTTSDVVTGVAGAEHPDAYLSVPDLNDAGRSVLRTSMVFAVTGIVLFIVLALTGIVMRMNQAEWVTLEPTWFYRLLTIHGAGMFVAMLMSMMGAFYYALAPSIPVSRASLGWSYLLVLGGAVTVIVAVLIGGFAGAWTFLFPLPFVNLGGWTMWAAITFLTGMVLLSLGWGVFFYEVLDQITSKYGGVARAMGIPYLFGRTSTPPAASVVGATNVAIVALLANVVGAAVVVAELVYGADQTTNIGMLWAKNLTYSFGHTIMNLLIYLAAVMLYTVIPRYTGRAWKTTKPLISAWLLTFFAVSAAYTHHLYMDFVQPMWAHGLGQIASSAAAIPVAVITVYTGILLSWGSKYRWTLASAFIYVGFAGWLTGGIAAVADSLIAVNFRFHNTLWVPAHFHSYLLLGVAVWAIAFLVHLLERAAGQPAGTRVSKLSVSLIVLGGYGFVGMWYLSGAKGVPRRWAVQPDGSEMISSIATICASALLLGVLIACVQMIGLARVARTRRRALATAGGVGVGGGSSLSAGAPVATAEPFDGAPAELPAPFSGRLMGGVGGLIIAIVALIVAMSPWLNSWAEGSVGSHHVQHAIQFGAGGIVGLWLGSSLLLLGAMRRVPRSMAALAVMVLQAGMMALMAPAFYREVEGNDTLHFMFHLLFVALGVVMGISSTRFSRSVAWFSVLLGVFGALLWAPGVS